MRKGTVLQGRGAKGPSVEGTALVCPNSILGWNGLDVRTGEIIEEGHIHKGERITGKILVMPCSRGSIAWSDYFDEGREWWGALCLTVYDETLGRFAVIMASATD